MAFPNDCESFFNCENGPKGQNITLEQFWKYLIVADEDGCPALRVSASVTASIESPENSSIGDALIEADTNADLVVAIAAWRTANPTFKQISMTQVNSVDKQAVIITYTT